MNNITTTVTGYPRIGEHRELKTALESFFRGETGFKELSGAAAEIRKHNYALMQQEGLDLIPVGDFSFYDNLLDAAVLFNLIPSRYSASCGSLQEAYFAMARGQQQNGRDLRALPMRKWFNTNYHAIEPEYDGTTPVKLNPDFILDLVREAADLKLSFKTCLVGPFTLLKHLRIPAGTDIRTLAGEIAEALGSLTALIRENGARDLALAEPSLVRDLTSEDIALFREIYSGVLAQKNGLRVTIETYFGDIRDVYKDVAELPFDGVALDFTDGSRSQQLIREQGFPEGRTLTAGVISGRNIWRADYDRILETVLPLSEQGISLALGTSCSLLHVPCTTELETAMDPAVRRHLAFAREKLTELRELKEIAAGSEGFESLLKANRTLHAAPRVQEDQDLAARISALKDSDFTRLPARPERLKIQKEHFRLPLLPTTTIGSFPQTAEVRSLRRRLKKGEITRAAYDGEIRSMIRRCITRQEEMGLDVLVHGEFERNDMVEYFGEHLEGCIFTANGWVQSYGSRCVKPPVIWGDVKRRGPITVDTAVFAQSCSEKKVKGMLTGPATILNWSFPRTDIPLRTIAMQIALALKEEAEDLEKAGIEIIQIDEAALKEKLPLRRCDQEKDYLSFTVPAFRLVHSGLKPSTQVHTHMCYSEFADILPHIDAMDADAITFEAARSSFALLDSLDPEHFGAETGPGIYDIHSPRIPPVEEMIRSIRLIVSRLGAGRVWVNPDCGLKTRGWPETEASLRNMVLAAAAVRKELEEISETREKLA